jgi:hypothetical protein
LASGKHARSSSLFTRPHGNRRPHGRFAVADTSKLSS